MPASVVVVLQISRGGSAPEDRVSLRRKAVELGTKKSVSSYTQPETHNRTAQYASYDAALEATGMFTASSPVAPAESGESEIYTQPFQVLSWYPRYATNRNTINLCTHSSMCQNMPGIALQDLLVPSILGP